MFGRSTSQPGRLNVFQKVMYQWSELHPYNAVHIYRLKKPLDLPKLREAVRQTYRANGLGLAEVSPHGWTYRHAIDPSPQILVQERNGSAEETLTRHVTRELNHRFERPRCRPLRFGVIEIDSAAHYLAVTYDHWIADGGAVRLILERVLGRYCDVASPAAQRPLDLYPGTCRELFGRRVGGASLALAAIRSLRQFSRNRSAAEVPYASAHQMEVQFQMLATAPETVARLQHFSRAQGATVQDVILAALARAMARYLPRRALRAGGQQLSLGTIVDTRRDADRDLTQALGVFLAYYLVRCRADDDVSLANLVQHIAGNTRFIKSRRRYFDSLIHMQFINNIAPWLRQEIKPNFLRKVMPMTGGISNVLLRDSWIERCTDGHVFDYLRACPTGPMLPIVLAPTTLGDRLNIGVTYRLTGFSSTRITEIMQAFLEDIERPGETHQAGWHVRKTGPVAA
jgi:NRPS condensation-like uncharacterized protein